MQTTNENVLVRAATWQDDRDAISDVRREVFVAEQGVPESIEMDGRDGDCWHVLALDGSGQAIGTGRLLPDGHIGRLAVLARWRGHGIGRRLLEALIERAMQLGLSSVALNAQTRAIGFYETAGFAREGEEFMEAGIPHVSMARRLDPG